MEFKQTITARINKNILHVYIIENKGKYIKNVY